MHHRITFQGDSAAIRRLADEILPLDGILGLAYDAGGSLKPRGDVLQVEVLNSLVDEVLRRARPAIDDASTEVAVVISQSTAVIDRARAHLINKDADEIIWEEMEADLRNHGRISWNYAILMTLGAVVACPGEAGVDEGVGRHVRHVVLADEIGLEAREPIILGGKDRGQFAARARHVDGRDFPIQRVPFNQRLRSSPIFRAAHQRNLGNAILDCRLPVRLSLNVECLIPVAVFEAENLVEQARHARAVISSIHAGNME